MKLFIQGDSEKPKLDPKVFEFRPKRNAAEAVEVRISEMTNYENELHVVEQYLLLNIASRRRV